MFLEIEKVTETKRGMKVGVIVYRNFLPPVTLIFEKEWGKDIRHIRNIFRTERLD